MSIQPKPGWKHFVQIMITAMFFTLVTWKFFEWKGIVSFVPFWIVFETVYRLKVRVEMSCPYCGFDPYLYLTDVKKARAEIENFWRLKFKERGIPFPGDPEPAVEDTVQKKIDESPQDSP